MKYLATLLLIPALFLSGCATDTGDAAKDTRGRVTNAALKDAFAIVLNFGEGYGASLLAGQNGQDAAKGAFLAAVNGNTALDAFHDLVAAYSGPQVAAVAATAYAQAAPKTQADEVLVVNTIGAALQQAANEHAS